MLVKIVRKDGGHRGRRRGHRDHRHRGARPAPLPRSAPGEGGARGQEANLPRQRRRTAAAPGCADASPGTRRLLRRREPPGVAMPAAAKLMAENNLGPGQVDGTGRGGRITKGDVLDALSKNPGPGAGQRARHEHPDRRARQHAAPGQGADGHAKAA